MTYNTDQAKVATKLDKRLLRNVHPLSARVMEAVSKPDVIKIPSVGGVLNEASLIRQVFLDRTHFSKIGKGVSSALWTPIIGDTGLLNMDGDPHIKLRRELAPSFSQKVVPLLVEEVFQTHIAPQLEKLNNGGEVDITQVTSEFAYHTLWKLLGFPEKPGVDFKKETEILRSVTEGLALHKKELPASQVQKARERLAFVEELAKEAYTDAVEGSVIWVMKEAGYSLEEVTSVTKALMVTGTETVISYIPRMIALFIRSGFMTDLAGNEAILDQGLDEAFRITVPTPVAARAVIAPVELGGRKFKPGQRVLLATVSACHKAGHFDPYRPLDKSLKGLWFGAGTHMCIGLPIAKAQASLVVEKLLETTGGNLEITEVVEGTRGHTGSYAKLVIRKNKR